jgi:hypothetical protein
VIELQVIHHVEVIGDPSKAFDDATVEREKPHFLLHLGQPSGPRTRSRRATRSRVGPRVVMIDLLLTSKTITEARDLTKQRVGPDAVGDVEENDDNRSVKTTLSGNSVTTST